MILKQLLILLRHPVIRVIVYIQKLFRAGLMTSPVEYGATIRACPIAYFYHSLLIKFLGSDRFSETAGYDRGSDLTTSSSLSCVKVNLHNRGSQSLNFL